MIGGSFEALWGAIPYPALVVDADDTIVTANPATESFGSTSLRQMAGRRFRVAIRNNFGRGFFTNYQARFSGFGAVRSLRWFDPISLAFEGIGRQPDSAPRSRRVESRPIDFDACLPQSTQSFEDGGAIVGIFTKAGQDWPKRGRRQ